MVTTISLRNFFCTLDDGSDEGRYLKTSGLQFLLLEIDDLRGDKD